ncbi:MAG TPA: YetF domain-containing protein [Gaiellaceae bacterium]|nr:YetF domain-containing protein [Gaiellaceae bacterium]
MDIVIRAFFAFLFVIIVTRVIGRRELSSLEPFDLILLIVLGDLIQQGVTQSDYSFTGLVLAGGTFTLLTVAVSYLVFRFRSVRPLFEPEPLVLVENGELIDRNLRRERLTPEELAAEARLQQIPSLADVRWAVLETSGKISFIPRARG